MCHILKNKILNFASFILFLLAWIVPLTFAQEHMGKGRISGIAVDEKGQLLEGVLVVVESMRYKTKLQSYTNKKGFFAVAGMGTGDWRITASKKGYISSHADMNIRQLRKNPPITFTLKRMTGYAAFFADEGSIQFFDKGNLLIKEEKYDEALAVFEELLGKHP